MCLWYMSKNLVEKYQLSLKERYKTDIYSRRKNANKII